MTSDITPTALQRRLRRAGKKKPPEGGSLERSGTDYFFIASADFLAESFAASAALPAASFAASAALPAASFIASAAAALEPEAEPDAESIGPLALAIAAVAALEAAVSTALAAALAASATAGMAAADAAAAGMSSFLPQALKARAATMEASRSDLVIGVLRISLESKQLPVIVGTLFTQSPNAR